MTRTFAGVVAAIAIAGIAPPAGQAARYHSRSLTFRYPASWHVHREVFPDGITVFARLSNTRVDRSCTFVRGQPTHCTSLPRGGVFVEWVLTDGWRPMPPSFHILRPGPCRGIGGDETILRSFWVPYYFAEACLRGPRTKEAERQVRAILASARFPHPP